MKRFLLLTLLFAFVSGLIAQEIKDKVPTTYNRSSLTILFLDFEGDNHWQEAKSKIDSLKFSEKYDNNNIDFIYLKPSFTRENAPVDLAKALVDELQNASVSQKVISKWYNRKPDGTMDMELVHKRGRFTATDADFLKAQTSKRGNAALEDFGNRLVNLSYILVLDISSIKTMAEAQRKGMRGWQANVSGYLYRLDFSEEIRNSFYDTWIYDDDTPAVKESKRKAYDALKVPIVSVAQKTQSISSSQSENQQGISLVIKPKTVDQLLVELLQKSYDETIYQIEMQVEEFKVKTSIFATRPIRAKIGLKEGLKTDYRFFAYEHVYNSKTNKVEPVRKGVIRVASKSKIVDNRKEASGDMGTSRFYQVAGKKLEAGFTLQQQNDQGVEVALGPEIGEVGGFYGRLDYRVGRFTGIKGLFVYGEGGVQAKEYFETFLFLRYGVGVAKGLQLTRNIELRPYIGGGAEQATNTNYAEDDALSTIYVKLGANLALNLKHNFQIVGGFGAYSFIAEAESKSGINKGPWNEFFTDRGGSSSFIGIKFGF